MLLGVHLPASRRWDGSTEFPTRCHPISAYRMVLRFDGMELRKKILNGRRAA